MFDFSRIHRLFVVTLLAGSAPACSVEDMDFTGKQCPCPVGWHCDSETQKCLSGDAPEDAGRESSPKDVAADPADGPPLDSNPDASHDTLSDVDGNPDASHDTLSDVEDSAEDSRPPSVEVTNLHVGWTTPNWIRWQWDLSGIPDELLGFELVTGRSEQDVVNRVGTAVVWTADENPELGRFFLPATGSQDPVVATLTSDHTPGADYFGQLSAIDTAGNRSVSNVATTRTTQAPSNTAEVFSETDIGYGIPSSVVLSDRFPFAGTYHYDFLSTCEPGKLSCYENVGRQGFTVPLTDIDVAAFESSAFLEIALAAEGSTTSYWSQLRFRLLDADTTVYIYEPWTQRPDGKYRVYQIPLRAFHKFTATAAGLSHDALVDPLWEIRLGGMWEDGARVSLDEIRVRW